ncbi:MAG: FAD-dependent 5-carboxymethylaminomethyl-2-thiouridine(34) oxidoreductase MnmC [Betaproteobacteria bacterium]|jgi:tRNA U-34 5-methylaminomethyl-2-thiouridine biosynthesis protein MnmC, C-terminal domain|nr:FAD-dependent 5-carboxymethylaminomethyl-2-thiouridine(34) oxidoreductase MnmC [Betaproteobacteria bacterium]
MSSLYPAALELREGVAYSARYNDVYHSRAGGTAQSRAVFLAGNGLPERWQHCTQFQILETGFGLGINFLTTWLTWRTSAPKHARLHFVSVEQSPFSHADLSQALSHHPELSEVAASLLASWPVLTPGFHRLSFDEGRVTLLLGLGDFATQIPQLTLAADAIYLDGFSPRHNPDAWSPSLLRQIARHCRHGATLASWCVAGHVRRALEQEGFRTQRVAGFGSKRERLEACYDKIPRNAWETMIRRARHQPLLQATLRPPPTRQALVIGAGLAGCLVSQALSLRGWHIDLFDALTGPAQAASGNPAGILRPHPSRDDNRAARLSRAGYFQAWQQLTTLTPCPGRRTGVLHLADHAEEAQHLQQLVRQLSFPSHWMRWCSAVEAESLGHCPAPWGGLWFAEAGWVDPSAWCRQALDASGSQLHCHWSSPIQLQPMNSGWQAQNAQGHILAQAPIVILACGASPLPLVSSSPDWAMQSWRGQITQIDSSPWASGHPVLCRHGYIIPDAPGGPCIGATYQPESDTTPRSEDDQENLQRWERLVGYRTTTPIRTRRVGLRNISHDRLPLIGPLSSHPGVFTLTALGSRGLALAPLGAALLSAWLEGEPLPLERDLIEAISPQRYCNGGPAN